MLLILLGLIIFGLAGIIAKSSQQAAKFGRTGRLVGIFLMLLGFINACVKQIDPGEAGIKILFGKVQNEVLGSGLHFVNPLLDIRRIDIKTQNYTMSGSNDDGHRSEDDAIKVLTSDGLEVTIDLTVLYRVIPGDAPRLLVETGFDYKDKVVRPIARTSIRDNAVYYQAIELFSTKRDEFQNRIYKSIENDFKRRGLLLEQLLVRNITLPASVKTAIEAEVNF